MRRPRRERATARARVYSRNNNAFDAFVRFYYSRFSFFALDRLPFHAFLLSFTHCVPSREITRDYARG